jgi:hypothetical protein
MDWSDFRGLVLDNLTDDLLTPKYRRLKKKSNVPATFGHCYVASEAAYYLLGGKEEGWKPMHMTHLGASHWFLKHESGYILDLTYNQFKSPLDYSKARGTGFLTKVPSKRAKKLLIRINESRALTKLKKSVVPLT